MTRLQEDLLGVYNTLTDFSEATITSPSPIPIRVSYSESLNSLCFEQKGLKVAVNVLNYYCENLKDLKESYLYPEDYDLLMSTLAGLIGKGVLLDERICVAPKKYGFDIYETNTRSYKDGPQKLASLKFTSGNSRLFRLVTKLKFKTL